MSTKNLAVIKQNKKQVEKRNQERAAEMRNVTRSIKEEAKIPQMKKVGQFLIDLNQRLGQGQYGVVYLA